MEYKEFTGRTVEEAVERGLEELGITAEQADVRILEEGKKKLFGSVKARVEIAVKESEEKKCHACEKESEEGKAVKTKGATDGERAVEFLEGLFKLLNITACTELVSEGEKVEINVTTTESTSVIGKHGSMLDAIQTLAGAVANTGREEYLRVTVDCENYREKREETLKKLAENLADKAVRLAKKIMLEPMNPYERRIIHSALSQREDVQTQSEGKEGNRYLVIIPENVEDPDAAPIPARQERDRRDRNFHKDRRNDRGGRGGKGSSRGGFNKRSYDRKPQRSGSSSAGGTSMKNNDFFGIFLGNSGDNEDKD